MIYEHIQPEQMAEAKDQLFRLAVRTLRTQWQQGHWLFTIEAYQVGADANQEATNAEFHSVLNLRSGEVHEQLTVLGHDEEICVCSSMRKSG